MLATQAMINLGEIQDPMSGELNDNLPGAETFMDLLAVVEEKTRGNLTAEEEKFLFEVKANLAKVYKKKVNLNTG